MYRGISLAKLLLPRPLTLPTTTINNQWASYSTSELKTRAPLGGLGAGWLMSYFPELLKEATDHILKFSTVKTATHFNKALDYAMQGGKRVRGLTTVQSYMAFADPKTSLNEKNLKLAAILGLLMEMTQAWLAIIDDIVDESTMRRGLPCWYLVQGVGMGAVNDGILISKTQFYLLRKYFGHLECYSRLVDILAEGELITMCGQSADYLTSGKTVQNFNINVYESIVANKASHYTIKMPTFWGMTLANVTDPELIEKLHLILFEIGCWFQINDDYWDCFGDLASSGKVGNDINEGKCTWLAVKFMELADEEQKRLFGQIYGNGSPENVAQVKQLYKDVGLPKLFKEFEESYYGMIKKKIDLLPAIPKGFLNDLLESIYGWKA